MKRPKSWAGNFAVVVIGEINSNKKCKALRFFLAKTPSHITQITSFISNNPHSSLVNCKMYRNMLTMKDGEAVDMMEMDFIDGLTLDDWVGGNVGQSGSCSQMAEALRATVNELVTIGFYHGDLSHSNIMINDCIPGGSFDFQERIRLIDYDSALVKTVSKPPKTKEVGHPNFQHPSRKASRFTMLEDVYFSTLLIYISLIALDKKPLLWEKYHSKGDNLIFQHQRGDLNDVSSPLWKDLENIKFGEEEKKAYECLKVAVKHKSLVGSDFLSDIEDWFSSGHLNPVPPYPDPPEPDPPIPEPDETSESPKPRPRTPKPRRSPQPTKRSHRSPPSPSPEVREKKDQTKLLSSIKNVIKSLSPRAHKNLDGPLSVEPLNETVQVQRPEIKIKTDKKKKVRNANKKGKSKTIPIQFKDLSKKRIILDGANIIHEGCAKGDLNLESIFKLIEQLEQANVESIHVVFDATTPHKLSSDDKKEAMYKLIEENKDRYTLAPRATEADSIILNIAHLTESLVITNDFYLDYEAILPDEFRWFCKHHITISHAMDIWTLNTSNQNQFLGD